MRQKNEIKTLNDASILDWKIMSVGLSVCPENSINFAIKITHSIVANKWVLVFRKGHQNHRYFLEVDAIGKFERAAVLRHMATPEDSQMHQIQSFRLQQPVYSSLDYQNIFNWVNIFVNLIDQILKTIVDDWYL